MFNPKQAAEMLQKVFNEDELEQIAALQDKPADEQMEAMADIISANDKIPDHIKGAFNTVAKDPELRAEAQAMQETMESGGFAAKAKLAVQMPQFMAKVQKKMQGQSGQ